MALTKVFQNGHSQAVRIPKEMQTSRKEFIIKQVGEVYIIYPADDPWMPLKQVMGTFPDDLEREQPGWDSVPDREAAF
jgi:antitoxin VapB